MPNIVWNPQLKKPEKPGSFWKIKWARFERGKWEHELSKENTVFGRTCRDIILTWK